MGCMKCLMKYPLVEDVSFLLERALEIRDHPFRTIFKRPTATGDSSNTAASTAFQLEKATKASLEKKRSGLKALWSKSTASMHDRAQGKQKYSKGGARTVSVDVESLSHYG